MPSSILLLIHVSNFVQLLIRQYKVGKHHSGKAANSKKRLGFKTIIKPSPENIKAHYQELARWIGRFKGDCVAGMIAKLNPIIKGWCNYHSPWHSKATFNKIRYLMWNKLWRWAKSRHPNKGKTWVAKKYFNGKKDNNVWNLSVPREEKNPLNLYQHTECPASVKWVKIEGNRSPYDGNWAYWSTRTGDKYKVLSPQLARLVEKQQGKCAYCGLKFMPDDSLEKHHLNHKTKGGNNTDKNLTATHLHCHDQIHALKEHEYDKWIQEIKEAYPAKRGWRKSRR